MKKADFNIGKDIIECIDDSDTAFHKTIKEKIKKDNKNFRLLKYRAPGMYDIFLSEYKWFQGFTNLYVDQLTSYYFRGQQEAKWSLISSFDRVAREKKWIIGSENESKLEILAENKHREKGLYALKRTNLLECFQRNARERCGLAFDAEKNDWWSLAQHHGVKTPLLDWTKAIGNALFFAYAEMADTFPKKIAGDNKLKSKLLKDDKITDKEIIENCVAVHALQHKAITDKKEYKDYFFTPLMHGNPRMVSQMGYFSMLPTPSTIEQFVLDNFHGNSKEEKPEEEIYLLRLLIPKDEYHVVIRSLELWGTHYATIYPDLHGSAQQTNMEILY